MTCCPFADEPDRVRTLLEDVENVRRAKMYEGMGTAAQEVQQAVKVTSVCQNKRWPPAFETPCPDVQSARVSSAIGTLALLP